jgi:DNA-binding response OmpR family regulator
VSRATRIAIVEDSERLSSLFEEVLRGAGYDVVVFPDGKSFLATNPESYDLALVDLMLPDIHGLTVIRTVASRVKCIAITGADVVLRASALLAGAQITIHKPVPNESLVQIVKAVLLM